MSEEELDEKGLDFEGLFGRDEKTGMYSRREFIPVGWKDKGDAQMGIVSLCRFADYMNRKLRKKSLPTRNDVKKGIYRINGDPIEGDVRDVIRAVFREALPRILMCGFSRSDSGEIGSFIDLENLQLAVRRGIERVEGEPFEETVIGVIESELKRRRLLKEKGNGNSLAFKTVP